MIIKSTTTRKADKASIQRSSFSFVFFIACFYHQFIRSSSVLVILYANLNDPHSVSGRPFYFPHEIRVSISPILKAFSANLSFHKFDINSAFSPFDSMTILIGLTPSFLLL